MYNKTNIISLTTTKKVKVKISEGVYFSFLYYTFDSPGWILKLHGKNVYHVSRCVPLSLSSIGPYPRSHLRYKLQKIRFLLSQLRFQLWFERVQLKYDIGQLRFKVSQLRFQLWFERVQLRFEGSQLRFQLWFERVKLKYEGS
jgi:hypothetical protein